MDRIIKITAALGLAAFFIVANIHFNKQTQPALLRAENDLAG